MMPTPPQLPRCTFVVRWAPSLALIFFLAGCGSPSDLPPVAVGAPAPTFELRDLEGTEVASADFSGSPTVINFWATWCAPCRKEKPELAALARAGEVAVVGVALDEKGAETVRPFVDKYQPPYAILLGDKATFQRFGGFSVPYSLLLDSDQKILKIYRGPVTKTRIERDLATARKG